MRTRNTTTFGGADEEQRTCIAWEVVSSVENTVDKKDRYFWEYLEQKSCRIQAMSINTIDNKVVTVRNFKGQHGSHNNTQPKSLENKSCTYALGTMETQS